MRKTKECASVRKEWTYKFTRLHELSKSAEVVEKENTYARESVQKQKAAEQPREIKISIQLPEFKCTRQLDGVKENLASGPLSDHERRESEKQELEFEKWKLRRKLWGIAFSASCRRFSASSHESRNVS